MKKTWLVLLTLALAGTLLGLDLRIMVGFNYSQGISSFFSEKTARVSNSGFPGEEQKQNKLGIGFKMSLVIRLVQKLWLEPSVSVGFGHQKYGFLPDDPSEGNPAVHEIYYFRNWAGGLDLSYSLLQLKNGWNVFAQTGFSLNFISGDEQIAFEKKSYLGWQAGIGCNFLQLKHWGFQAQAYFKTLFTSEGISWIGANAGLFYKI